MRLNWINYGFDPCDGYGRFSAYMVRALTRAGVKVNPICPQQMTMPDDLRRMAGFHIDYSHLTISCVPPFGLSNVPGRHWQFTMTEGSKLPDGWLDDIVENEIERVIVPCQWNAEAFQAGGVDVPIDVIPGGIEPDDLPVVSPNGDRPYTFLTLADRGGRKGWVEVWQAFYKTFGSPDRISDVRLVIKTRADGNELIKRMAEADNPDPRIRYWQEDVDDVADVFGVADCVVLPSRSEGWGLPMREAAAMGIPVVTSRHSGLDDGHTHEWAIPIRDIYPEAIPSSHKNIEGQWYKVNIEELASIMSWCYDRPDRAALRGRAAAVWLRANQTWDHSARQLADLIKEHA